MIQTISIKFPFDYNYDCNIFSVLSIFKYDPGKANDKSVTCSDEKKKKRRITVYGFGHSLWSAISCQRKWLTSVAWSGEFWRQLQDVENINNVSPNFSKVSLSLSLSLSPSPTNKRYQYSSDCRRGSALHFYLPLSSVYHYHDRLFVLRGEGEAFLPNVCCESTLGARSCLTVWLSQSREERFWTVYVCIYLPARRAQVLSFLKCCLSRVRYHTSRGFNLR